MGLFQTGLLPRAAFEPLVGTRHSPAASAAWLLLFSLALVACDGGGGEAAPASPPVQAAPPVVSAPPASPLPVNNLGLMKLTIEGLGGSVVTSKAEAVPAAGSASGAKAFTTQPLGIDLDYQAATSVDVGGRGSGGMRYIDVIYKVRNAEYCPTSGSCPAYGTARSNLTLIAANVPGSINGTAIAGLFRFDGSPAAAALATQVLPTHGMRFDRVGGGVLVDAGLESLQVFTEAEVATITPYGTANYLYPYGYVVSNVRNPGSRSLPANPASNQFDGQLAFAFKLPLQATAADDPWSITMFFEVLDDTNTRVTQSAEEQTPTGDGVATARATVLGGTDVAVLGGRVAQTAFGMPICTVRTAGPAASPTAYLVNNGSAATLGSAPFNVWNIDPLAGIRVGFCTEMQAATAGNFVVSGSQSGVRVGSYTGGGTRQLQFTPTVPFIPGETVSYTLVGGAAGLPSIDVSQRLPASFVGLSGVGGLLPSSAALTPSLLGSGFGGFLRQANVGVGQSPFAIAGGDFNGDGKPDLASVSTNERLVSILLGNGDGSFPSRMDVSLGSHVPLGIAVGDFNGDGYLDFATANAFVTSTVSVVLGVGDGSFQPPATFAVGNEPYALVEGDFNSDGKPDLATANNGGNSVSILLGNGDGSFQPEAIFAVGNGPYALVAGDFNNDGKPDLATANNNANSVSVLLGNGDGSFQPKSDRVTGNSPISIAVGDFNGDGRPDLATANFISSGTASILLGNGDGSFQPKTDFAAGAGSRTIVVRDFNDDGKPDLAIANQSGASVSTLLGNGDGSFQPSVASGVASDPQAMVASDFNSDGKSDLATVSQTQHNVSVLLGRKLIGSPTSAAAGDFDADGRPDVAIANGSLDTLAVFPSSGGPAQSIAVGRRPQTVAVGDVNGDGKPDLASANLGDGAVSGTVSVALNDGSGGFLPATTISVSQTPASLAFGDFNGDGKADLAVVCPSCWVLVVLIGDGTGAFTALTPVSLPGAALSVTTGDFNGDGRLDLAAANFDNYTVTILRGDGAGGFTVQPQILTVGTLPFAIVAADFNNDGKPDLATANFGDSNVSLLIGDGSGGFAVQSGIPVGINPQALAVGDLNGDGRPDLATSNIGDGSVATLINDRSGGFLLRPVTVGVVPGPLVIADFRGTSKLSIAVADFATEVLNLLTQP